MPALPDVPKVIRTSLAGETTAGGVWLTRFFSSYSGTAPTNAQLVTWNSDVGGAYDAHVKPLVDIDTTLTQIESVDLTSPTSAAAINPASDVGTRVGLQNPAAIAMVISYEIGRRYRGGHPRGYWSMGVQEDLEAKQKWLDAFVTEVDTAMPLFFSQAYSFVWSGGVSMQHVNVSYYQDFDVVISPTTGRARNVPRVRAVPLVDAVTSLAAKSSIGTQRRRAAFID